jgi:hypothetical protein
VTRAKISEYSATAGDNTDVNGVNIAEGCPPSSMNNMGREIMAALKRFQVGSDGDGVTVGGALVVSGATTLTTVSATVVQSDTVSEKTSAAGVTIDGVLLKDSQVTTDQINEKTSAAGVTIDGVLLKDSGVVTGAGTVSAPVYSTTGDTNTGIFFPAADTIAFAEGGAEAMRIDSSGNVGIGTSSAVERLTVVNTATSDILSVYRTESLNGNFAGITFAQNNSSSAKVNYAAIYNVISSNTASSESGVLSFYTRNSGTSAERMRIASSGNVGIGTSSPSSDAIVKFINVSDATSAGLVLTGPRKFSMYSSAGSTLAIRDETAAESRMIIDSSGNLLVGTTALLADGNYFATSPGNAWSVFAHVNGTSSGVEYAKFYYNNGQIGSITQNGTTAVAYNTSSDYRLKHDIQPMTGALAKVAQLKPVTYKWNADDSQSQGFVAHELQEVVPECVTGEKDAVDAEGNPQYQGIDTSFLVATLTAAIQEQQAIINDLKARLDAANL